MPKNLTEVDNFDSNVTVPVSLDSRTAASVEIGFQQLANRTTWLKNKVDSIDPGGVSGIHPRKMANITSLKALTDMSDGEIILCPAATGSWYPNGYLLLAYDVDSTVAECLPNIVAPNSGIGRWVHVTIPGSEQNSGFAQYSGSGILDRSRILWSRWDLKSDHVTHLMVEGDSPTIVADVYITVGTTDTWYPMISTWGALSVTTGAATASIWIESTKLLDSTVHGSSAFFPVGLYYYGAQTISSGTRQVSLKITGGSPSAVAHIYDFGIRVELLKT